MRPIGQDGQLLSPGLLVVVVDVVDGPVAQAVVVGRVTASLHPVAGVGVHVLGVSACRCRKLLPGRPSHGSGCCVEGPARSSHKVDFIMTKGVFIASSAEQ